MPPQGRLTLEVARRPYRPDLHRLVPAAASDEFAISTEADRHDPVLETSQHVQHGGMNSSNTKVINSPVGVPPHRALRIDFFEVPVVIKRARALRVVVRVPPKRRLEFTRRRVTDFHGFVPAAAGNLFTV